MSFRLAFGRTPNGPEIEKPKPFVSSVKSATFGRYENVQELSVKTFLNARDSCFTTLRARTLTVSASRAAITKPALFRFRLFNYVGFSSKTKTLLLFDAVSRRTIFSGTVTEKRPFSEYDVDRVVTADQPMNRRRLRSIDRRVSVRLRY